MGGNGNKGAYAGGGVGFVDGLAVGFDPGVGGEGLGAYSSVPGGPGAVGAAEQGGGDRAGQAAVSGAAHADSDDGLAGGGGLVVGGGPGMVGAPGQHAADPAGRQAADQVGGADGDQRQQAPVPGQPVAFLDGYMNAHGVSSPAVRRWSIRLVTSARARSWVTV